MALSVILALALVASVSGASFESRLDVASCGTHTMAEGERLILQSPNFPKPYSTNNRCQWEITCPTETDHYLEFICPTFILESSTDCVKDRLVLASRGERTENCGTDSPDGTITSTGWARLTFFSNADTVKQGFRCYVWCRANPTTSTAAPTTAATTTAAITTAATTTAATTTAATTTAATTTAATTTAATTTAATTTAATTTAATTTAATTTAATTTAATTTAATTTAATTTAATTTAATTTAATTTAATTTAATTTAATTTAAATTVADATTTAATTTAATTTAATTTAATTTAATTTAATTTAATTTAATTTAATTTAASTTAATTTAATTTAATTTAATTTAATTTTGATTTVGFDLKACGVHELTEGQRVVIQTPNFPQPYTVDDRCQWEFSCPVEADHYLEFICPKFALESSTDCTADRLTVTSRGQKDIKCGSDSPDGTITSTGWARLTYFSNADTVAAGFRCYVWCRAK